MQTLFQRTVSAGLFFPLEDIFFQSLLDQRERRKSSLHDRWIALAAGNLAGAASGLLLNPLAAVKVRPLSGAAIYICKKSVKFTYIHNVVVVYIYYSLPLLTSLLPALTLALIILLVPHMGCLPIRAAEFLSHVPKTVQIWWSKTIYHWNICHRV
mgnify:FL=1